MLNQIAIMGRLVKDPELRYVNETPFCAIRIACDRDYKKENGEKEADFFDVVSWRRLAEIVNQYAAKGRMVSVVGRLQMRLWQDGEGKKRYFPEIVAEHVYFCDPKPKEEGAQNNGAASNACGYGQAPANNGGYGTSGGYGGGYGRNGYGQSPANGGRNAANNGSAQASDNNGNGGYSAGNPGNGGASGYGNAAAGYAANANGYGAAGAEASAPPPDFVPNFNEDGDPF